MPVDPAKLRAAAQGFSTIIKNAGGAPGVAAEASRFVAAKAQPPKVGLSTKAGGPIILQSLLPPSQTQALQKESVDPDKVPNKITDLAAFIGKDGPGGIASDFFKTNEDFVKGKEDTFWTKPIDPSIDPHGYAKKAAIARAELFHRNGLKVGFRPPGWVSWPSSVPDTRKIGMMYMPGAEVLRLGEALPDLDKYIPGYHQEFQRKNPELCHEINRRLQEQGKKDLYKFNAPQAMTPLVNQMWMMQNFQNYQNIQNANQNGGGFTSNLSMVPMMLMMNQHTPEQFRAMGLQKMRNNLNGDNQNKIPIKPLAKASFRFGFVPWGKGFSNTYQQLATLGKFENSTGSFTRDARTMLSF